MSPEEKARLIIDNKLKEAGYAVQDVKEFKPMAALGVVVRGWQTDSGSADYMIFIDKRPVGVIEAKAHDKGESLNSFAIRGCYQISSLSTVSQALSTQLR